MVQPGVFATPTYSFRKWQNDQETRADVAQPVEQRFRKPPVGSSSLPVGSESLSLTSGATLRAERAKHPDLLRHAAQGQRTDAFEAHAVA